VKTAYATLLEVREVEERDAELALAEARAAHDTALHELEAARALRAAWIADQIAEPSADAAAALARLEAVERDAERSVAETEQRVEQAREALLERRRARQMVETLHLEAIEAEARARSRRAQAELDDFGALRFRAQREDGDGSPSR
jgi:flagellar export protein FliJ